MKKSLLKVLTISAMCLGMPLLNACSFFRSDNDNAVGIKDVLVDYDEQGNALITINYTDKNKEPVSFVIPKGTDGEIGVGIKKVDYEQDDKGNTTVTISFTKESMEPVTFVLAPGKSISDVRFDTDNEENTLIIFIDSDGNELSPITVFKGDSGEAGVGILSIIPEYHQDGSSTLKIQLSDDSTYDVEIPAPKEGRGIASIISRKEGTTVILLVNYTDGTFEEITFESTPSWTSGVNEPNNADGYNGDYYFDTYHDIIYVKDNGSWVVAVDFSSNQSTYTITFDLNDTPEQQAYFVGSSKEIYPGIKKGETFYSSGYAIPLAARSGYTFEGWATTRVPNITSGLFTDLTPIVSDMTLYAVWR